MKIARLFTIILFTILVVNCSTESAPDTDDIIDEIEEALDEESNDDSEEDSDSESDDSNSDNDSDENDDDSNDSTEDNSENTDDSSDSDDTIDDNASSDDSPEGCDNENATYDDTTPSEGECAQLLNEGTISCIANTVPFESTGIFAGGVFEEEDAFVFGIIGGDGIDESVAINQIDQRGIALTISSSNLGLTDLQTNVVYEGTNGANLFNGGFEVIHSYVKVVNCESEEIGSDFSPTAKLMFTKIDADNQLVSGTFEFVAFDEETGNSYPVTSGTFTDIWYCNQGTVSTKLRTYDGIIKKLLRQ